MYEMVIGVAVFKIAFDVVVSFLHTKHISNSNCKMHIQIKSFLNHIKRKTEQSRAEQKKTVEANINCANGDMVVIFTEC